MHENKETQKVKRETRDAGRQIVDSTPASLAEMGQAQPRTNSEYILDKKLES